MHSRADRGKSERRSGRAAGATFLPTLNPIEPPWYGPVCPVVWEGWRREVSPYPDQHSIITASKDRLSKARI